MTPYLVKKMADAHRKEIAETLPDAATFLVAWHGVEIATGYSQSALLAQGRQLFLDALGLKKGGNAIDWLATALLKNNRGLHYAEAWEQATHEVMTALTDALSQTKEGRKHLPNLEPLQSTCTLRMRQRVHAQINAVGQ